MHPAPRVRRARSSRLAVLPLTIGLLGLAQLAQAGGQGKDIPPYILPVAQTELRIASHARMVCVADPATVCVAPYLDASPNSTNTDGGTFRSASCPGGPPQGACRPDYIAGAEITGELIVDWPVTRTPPDPLPVPDPDPGVTCLLGEYKICEVGHIELDVTAPGVSVSNPLWQLDSSKCDCVDPTSQPDSNFNGTSIDRWWQTRNKGATCDVALEYAWEVVSRDTLLQIGREAFPSLLCSAGVDGVCTIAPVPVLVEPDGSLIKGCGDPPSNTFLIRFAQPNEPIAFVRKSHQGAGAFSGPKDVGDATGDGAADLVQGTTNLRVNDGNNRFSDQPTGLSGVGQNDAALADWTDDGDLDLVNGNLSSGVRVYPGDGAGGFDAGSSFVLDAGACSDLETADLNADGLPDGVSEGGGSTRVIWNQTLGPIAPAVEPISMPFATLVDLDADSASDVVGLTSGSPTDVRWSANGGPGGFATPQTAVSIETAADALVPVLTQEIVDVLRCDPYGSNCCLAHHGFGCDDAICQAIVQNSPIGCDINDWDENCQEAALEECGVCMAPGTSNCCYEHAMSGCDLPSCETMFTTLDPDCLSNPWNDNCASEARGWCNECHVSNVSCTTTVQDVDAADADGDGDVDLFVSIGVDMVMVHSSPSSDYDTFAGYVAWLPNLQGAGSTPVFDTGVEPWRLLGRGAGGQLEMVDLDGDTDPDVVGVGFWYRNEGGSFTGPHALGLGSVVQGCGVDGLVGYWRFSGDAADATGCANDGVVSGAMLAPDVDGTADSAYAFDGLDDVVNVGSSSTLDPALPVTISLWVRHDCAASCHLFSNDFVSGGSYLGFWVDLTAAGELEAGFGDGTGASSSDRRSATGATVLTPNVWYHAAVVIEPGATPSFSFYVDGVQIGTTPSGTGGPIAYVGNDALIGNNSPSAAPFEGRLDEIRLYDRALSQEEIQALPAPGDPIAALLLDPAEQLSTDTLLVEDLDGDADLDVVGKSQVWERVAPVPEPSAPLMLGAGIVALLLLARRRARR